MTAEKSGQKVTAAILRDTESQKKEAKKSLVKFGEVKLEDTYRIVGLMKGKLIVLDIHPSIHPID